MYSDIRPTGGHLTACCKIARGRRGAASGHETLTMLHEPPAEHRRDRLRLIVSETLLPQPRRVPPVSLESMPFRPGELPVISWLVMAAETRDLIETSASAARVPPEIWVRVAVESSRLVGEISRYTTRQTDWVVAKLDAACQASSAEHDVLSGSALDRYADRLQASHPPQRISEEFALRLPEEMTDSWRRDATRCRMTMPQWIADRLSHAPSTCLTWEITAARSRQSLGEWAYASSLRALAKTSACAQHR